MQDIIVGGAVATAVSAAVFNGLKADTAEMCDLCQGVGMVPVTDVDVARGSTQETIAACEVNTE